MKIVWIVSAVTMALCAAVPASAQRVRQPECARTAWYKNNPNDFAAVNQLCATPQNVLDVTLVQQLQAQNELLRELVAQMTALTAANTAFRDTFQRVVTQNQTTLRDDVVRQLTAIPGQVVADPALVQALSNSVAHQLTANEEFLRSVRERPAERRAR